MTWNVRHWRNFYLFLHTKRMKLTATAINYARPIRVSDRCAVMGPAEALYPNMAVYILEISDLGRVDGPEGTVPNTPTYPNSSSVRARTLPPIYVTPDGTFAIVLIDGVMRRSEVHALFAKHAGNVDALRAEANVGDDCDATETTGPPIHNNFILRLSNKCIVCNEFYAASATVHLCSSCTKLRTTLGRAPTQADYDESVKLRDSPWKIAAKLLVATSRGEEKLLLIINHVTIHDSGLPPAATFFAEVKHLWGDAVWFYEDTKELLNIIRLRVPSQDELANYECEIYSRVVDFWNLISRGCVGEYYSASMLALPTPQPPETHASTLLGHMIERASNLRGTTLGLNSSFGADSVRTMFGP